MAANVHGELSIIIQKTMNMNCSVGRNLGNLSVQPFRFMSIEHVFSKISVTYTLSSFSHPLYDKPGLSSFTKSFHCFLSAKTFWESDYVFWNLLFKNHLLPLDFYVEPFIEFLLYAKPDIRLWFLALIQIYSCKFSSKSS